MTRRLLRALLLAALMLLMCSPALAAQKMDIDLSPNTLPEGLNLTLHARQIEDRWTLCIPGSWDVSDVTVTFSRLESFRAGDMLLESGKRYDLTGLVGQTVKLSYPGSGNKFGTLTVYQGSRVPALFLEVDAKQLTQVDKSKNNEIKEGHVVYTESDGSVTYDGNLTSFKGRGNSTFAYKKKPYQLKLDQKADLSGMGKHKTWILLANHLDLSLLRNQITLDLAHEMKVPNAIEARQVDVYLNGNYNGLYLLTEKVQIGPLRVNITEMEEAMKELNDQDLEDYRRKTEELKHLRILKYYEIPHVPEDITGGFLLEIEKPHRLYNQETNGFRTRLGVCVTIKEPEASTREQNLYIAELFNDFHEAVYAKDGMSPTGKYYTEYIDLPSFTAKYLIEELVKNYDALASSQFLHKDSDLVDGKIYFGPLWDYDLSYGNIQINGFISGSQPEKAYLTMVTQDTNIYYLLSQHEDFMQGVIAGFHGDLAPAVRVLLGMEEPQEGSRLKSIDQYAADIEASAQMNFSRWPENLIQGYYEKSGATHEASLRYFKEWIGKRFQFMLEMWPEE